MKSGLRLDLDNGKSMFYVCPATNCTGEYWSTAYSRLHAKDLGWYITSNEQFSPNGKEVAVCNTCFSNWLTRES